jgi:hypothetical protein
MILGGFTKLCDDFNTQGTERYLRNMAVWLLGLDLKLLSVVK